MVKSPQSNVLCFDIEGADSIERGEMRTVSLRLKEVNVLF
jgi:hypothetical protein